MWVDILKLRAWYQTLQGRLAQRVIRRQLHRLLPDEGQEGLICGIGYCQPYLPNHKEQKNIFLAMPAFMGGVAWPEGEKGRAVLVHEGRLSFHDNTFDTILLCHALEMAGDADALLSACWQALRPDGRLVVMVPNRAGAWARRDSTIFAHGHPYSPNQLAQALRQSNFTLTQSEYALFMPPVAWRWVLKFYETFEKIGQRWHAPIGGVILAQARKDIYGMKVVRSRHKSRRSFVHVPVPATENRRN